jgi:hypothetical protein
VLRRRPPLAGLEQRVSPEGDDRQHAAARYRSAAADSMIPRPSRIEASVGSPSSWSR